jgi:hypothetical protein
MDIRYLYITVFPFPSDQNSKQTLNDTATKALIEVAPDRRFEPIFHLWGYRGRLLNASIKGWLVMSSEKENHLILRRPSWQSKF